MKPLGERMIGGGWRGGGFRAGGGGVRRICGMRRTGGGGLWRGCGIWCWGGEWLWCGRFRFRLRRRRLGGRERFGRRFRRGVWGCLWRGRRRFQGRGFGRCFHQCHVHGLRKITQGQRAGNVARAKAKEQQGMDKEGGGKRDGYGAFHGLPGAVLAGWVWIATLVMPSLRT